MQLPSTNLRAPKLTVFKLRSVLFLVLFYSMFLLSANSALATITLSFQGNNFFTPISTTNPVIYMGMTDHNNCSGFLCDSCASSAQDFSPNATCSVRDIHTTDNLTITVNDSGDTGFKDGCLYYSGSGGGTTTTSWNQITTNFSFSGNTATILLQMGNVCSMIGATTTCTTSNKGTLSIGWTASPCTGTPITSSVQIAFRYVNGSATGGSNLPVSWGCTGGSLTTDLEGICNFVLFPGDGKAFINAVEVDPSNTGLSVPNLNAGNFSGTGVADPSGIIYSGLAIFATEVGPTSFKTSTDSAILTLQSAKGLISPKYIDGLTNGTPYFIGLASVDQAGILTYFGDSSLDPTHLKVTPEPVYGLLNGQGCFIATAAYGSMMAPEVDTFRKFRGKFLMSSELGRWFSRTYYKYSPPLAEIIHQSEALKFLARLVLLPMLLFVQLSLQFGIVTAGVFSVLLLLSLFMITRWYRLRRLA